MMYRIFKDGDEINSIVADETFVKSFCTKNGYTYEKMPDRVPAESEPDAEEPAAELSVWDELDAAHAEGYREGVDSV